MQLHLTLIQIDKSTPAVSYTINKQLPLRMYRELLPLDPHKKGYNDRIDTRLNQALAFRALHISKYTCHRKRGRDFFTQDDDLSHRAIYRLNRIIKSFYKIKQSDRNLICHQVAVLLGEAPTLSIIKLDLKSFYKNINTEKLLNKIRQDRLFCPYTLDLLQESISPIFNQHPSGLPEGISLSASLSELYMRDFDRLIAQQKGTVFYSRFVDDIIIFTSQNPAGLVNEITAASTDLVVFNSNKTYIYDNRTENKIDFDYLGYRFLTQKDRKEVKIEISKKKINRIKSKIFLSVIQFGRDGSQWHLEERLKYLTGNAELVASKRSTPFKCGIYYTYQLATPREACRQLRKLDQIIFRLTASKRGRFSRCLSSLSRADRRKLSIYKFSAGFKNRKLWRYDMSEIETITKPWRYA